MFNNLKLSSKIGAGFGAVLVITAVLGLIATFSMVSSRSIANKLALEYAPEVEIVNEFERSVHEALLDIRGYALTEDRKSLDEGLVHLVNAKKALQDAKALSEKYQDLVALKQGVEKADARLQEYEKLIQKTEAFINSTVAVRKKMDEAAIKFMKNAEDYTLSQESKLKDEISAGLAKDKLLERAMKVDAGNLIMTHGNEIRVAAQKFQAYNDEKIAKDALPRFDTINTMLDKLKAITTQDVNLTQIEIVRTTASEYKAGINELVKNFEAVQALNQERLKVSEEVVTAAESVSVKGIENTKKYADSAAVTLNVSSIIVIIGLVVALIIGIFMSLYIISSITKPIRNIVQGLSEGAGQVSAASTQLSSASQQLAEASSEQAASIEETSSTLEESASMVRQNTENTRQAAILASQARSFAEKGNGDMREMLEAMDQMKKSSDKIAKIIKVIDEIAFQTNILALNAAVEAARAGEAGMGFAVVAEEVRSLAQRSAQAAKDTAEMIEGNIELSGRGVDASKKVAEVLSEIMVQAKKVNEIMDEISTASQEQSQGINQINKAVSQMEMVVQQNAATSEESAASSEELNAQAEMLMDIVKELVVLVEGHNSTEEDMLGMKKATKKRLPAFHNNTRGGTFFEKKIQPQKTSAAAGVINPNDVIPLEKDTDGF